MNRYLSAGGGFVLGYMFSIGGCQMPDYPRVLKDEGFRSKPYKDSTGTLTFGHGLTYITKEESAGIVGNRLWNIHTMLWNKYSWYKRSPEVVQDVVIEMVFQMGAKGFNKFRKTRKALSQSDYKTAASEMLDSQWARTDSPARAKRAAKRVRLANAGPGHFLR